MAIVDTNIGLDMFNNFHFSVLMLGDVTTNTSNLFMVEQLSGPLAGRYDALFGVGMALGSDVYGRPVISGIVTDYEFGAWDGTQYVAGLQITNFAVGFDEVIAAAITVSAADDTPVLAKALAGNDTIIGSDYADVLSGFAGDDNIRGWGENDILYGAAGNDIVEGDGGNDTLYGDAGNDSLDGNAGINTLFGGLGNDTFYVSHPSDRVFDALGQGTDSLWASVSYTLAAGQSIEFINAWATAYVVPLNLTGNEQAQTIQGNNGINVINGAAGNDIIRGLSGNDTLYGGLGLDNLTGGAGLDRFVFNTAPSTANYDRVVDFYAPQDTMVLENGVLIGLGAALGVLNSNLFWKSTTGVAHDATDRIIYETDTGWLRYDSNGTAAGGAVVLALLGANLPITNVDFLVS